MTDHGLLIIGSGPGAVAAAVAYREANGTGPVRLVTDDCDPPYERPPLSKDFLRGVTAPDDVYLHPESFYAEHGIELRRSAPVRSLDVEEHAVVLAGSGERLGWDTCVLATGSAPMRPPIPGAEASHVHVLRSMRDALALRTAAASAERAVVAGSGFIGCEGAASLAARGLAVTLITDETRPHDARLGEWAANRIAEWLRDCGVELVTGDRLVGIRELDVHTEAGRTVSADLVLLATGVKPRVQLAEQAGLVLEQNRVRVDAAMRTSADGVYAVGDVAFADNTSAGRPLAVEHWGDALAMGEIAGKHAAGRAEQWSQAPGFWSTIGSRTVKYSAWGDGYDDTHVVEHDNGGFTIWYRNDGDLVGVLTHERDDDYERGQKWLAGSP